MRTIFSVAFFFLVASCSDNNKTSASQSNLHDAKLDSAKWLYYAYTYNGKVLFEKNNQKHSFSPVECDVSVEEQSNHNDTLVYKLNFSKKDFNYSHIYDGLMVYGFKYFNGTFVPLTGMVKLDHFDNIDFAKQDNNKTDSAFAAYIKETDQSKLSNWVVNEAKRRNIL
jgi:hypothetical protein